MSMENNPILNADFDDQFLDKFAKHINLTKDDGSLIDQFKATMKAAPFRCYHTAEIYELKRQLLIAQEALVWCKEMLFARDEMNAKVHCAPVRLSPITERVIQALESLK